MNASTHRTKSRLMTAQWTADQILDLAPDAASAKNGRSLATSRKWVSVGASDRAIWGECQGSGKTPYRTQIDLSEPAFRCSCPSRKFPCKHGLGLFLLWAEQPFEGAEPPDWVAEWLAGREQRQEKAARTVDADAQAKRAGDRQRKITAGIQDLRLWLEDRVRQGLANLPQEPYAFWDAPAARLVDAQAPGLARQVRELATVVHTGNDWVDRLLGQLARLYLLTEGFDRLETLPPQVQADLRTQIGWAIAQEDVLAAPGQADLWLVVGQRTEKEDPLRVRRVWLLGLASGKSALLLDFAHGTQPFAQAIVSGICLDAELAFYPSAYPLRAVIKTQNTAAPLFKPPPGYESIASALAAYQQAFAVCPWIDRFPFVLEFVTPICDDDWRLHDRDGLTLAILQEEAKCWQLLALSGGQPLTVFGEWNGEQFAPLSVWAAGEFYGLG